MTTTKRRVLTKIEVLVKSCHFHTKKVIFSEENWIQLNIWQIDKTSKVIFENLVVWRVLFIQNQTSCLSYKRDLLLVIQKGTDACHTKRDWLLVIQKGTGCLSYKKGLMHVIQKGTGCLSYKTIVTSIYCTASIGNNH